jgi:hypothetical protein
VRSPLDRIGSLRAVYAPPPLGPALVGPVLLTCFAVAMMGIAGAPPSLVAPFGVAVAGILLWSPLRLRGYSVALHAAGLVISRGAARAAIPFEDVNEVWFEVDWLQGQGGPSLRALRLVDYSGAKHRLLLGLIDAGALADAVVRGCAGPLLLEARRALARGETLTNGRVQIDRQCIAVKGSRLPWSEVRLLVVQRARVYLYRRFPIFAWRTVRLDRIPHPTVFLGLVTERARRVRVDDQILVPFATSAEEVAAVAGRYAAEGGDELALRHMAMGGVSFLIGALLTWASFSTRGSTRYLVYGPMVFGALWFFRGLSAYLSRRRR